MKAQFGNHNHEAGIWAEQRYCRYLKKLGFFAKRLTQAQSTKYYVDIDIIAWHMHSAFMQVYAIQLMKYTGNSRRARIRRWLNWIEKYSPRAIIPVYVQKRTHHYEAYCSERRPPYIAMADKINYICHLE